MAALWTSRNVFVLWTFINLVLSIGVPLWLGTLWGASIEETLALARSSNQPTGPILDLILPLSILLTMAGGAAWFVLVFASLVPLRLTKIRIGDAATITFAFAALAVCSWFLGYVVERQSIVSVEALLFISCMVGCIVLGREPVRTILRSHF